MQNINLEIGACYGRGDDAEYLVLYRTSKFTVVLHYSYNHRVGVLEFWDNNDTENDDLKKIEDYPLTEYIDYIDFVDNQTVKLE